MKNNKHAEELGLRVRNIKTFKAVNPALPKSLHLRGPGGPAARRKSGAAVAPPCFRPWSDTPLRCFISQGQPHNQHHQLDVLHCVHQNICEERFGDAAFLNVGGGLHEGSVCALVCVYKCCVSVVLAGWQVDKGEDVVLDEAGETQEDQVK